MAYNVFKRPMFKRGGATTGTGIMSHVEPRVKAQSGYFANTPLYPQPISNIRASAGSPIMNYGSPVMMQSFPLNASSMGVASVRTPTKTSTSSAQSLADDLVSVGGYGEIEPGPKFNLETAPDWMLNAIGTEESRKILKDREEGKSGIEAAVENIKSDNIKKQIIAQKAAEKEEQIDTEQEAKEDIKYEEADIKTDIEKEIELLQETLGPSISKGEKALLIAKAAATPGGITAKLDTAREEGLKLAKQKSKDDRAIKLAAYKAAKDIQKTKIAAGKLGETERLYDQYAKLSVKEDRTPEEEAKLNALKTRLEKTDNLEAIQRTYAAKVYDANRIRSLRGQIADLESKKPLSDLQQKDLAKKEAELEEQLLYKSILGLKEGGRVMKQMGGSMNDNSITSTETVTQDQVEPSKTVQTLSYAELRDRLPKEITDDIVQLISASERALQDFAYIRTQQDVNDFNAKYGVNLVLPASAT